MFIKESVSTDLVYVVCFTTIIIIALFALILSPFGLVYSARRIVHIIVNNKIYSEKYSAYIMSGIIKQSFDTQ